MAQFKKTQNSWKKLLIQQQNELKDVSLKK